MLAAAAAEKGSLELKARETLHETEAQVDRVQATFVAATYALVRSELTLARPIHLVE
jgi:hypothetical protein